MKDAYFKNVPNAISASRLFVAALLVMVLSFFDQPYLYCLFAGYGLFSDWLDGYVARVKKAKSAFGGYFDPLADKALQIVLIYNYSWEILPFTCGIYFAHAKAIQGLALVIIVMECFIMISSAPAVVMKIDMTALKSGKSKMLFEGIALTLAYGATFTGATKILLIFVILAFLGAFLAGLKSIWDYENRFLQLRLG